MLTEEDKKKVAVIVIQMMMQAFMVCNWKRKIAMRAGLRQPKIDRSVARRDHIARLITENDNDCYEQLRMRIAPFHRLVHRLRGLGLRDNRSVTVEEQVAIFLGTLAHDVRYRKTKLEFFRSSYTVSKYFHQVLNAVLQLYTQIVTSPTPAHSPFDCINSKDWHHYFKDAIGAIDGTHIVANVPTEDQVRYRNRKGIVSQNVLVACSFDMKFTYVLTGWEGSAHDGRVLRSAITRQGRKLTIPAEKYYLADAGYPSCPGFLTPYRSVRYHLRDQEGRRPQNYKELYNFRHSSLRNVVERTIGLLKKRFAYLRNNTFHDIVTQSKIISACAAIHNYLRDEDRNDELWDEDIEADVLPIVKMEQNGNNVPLTNNSVALTTNVATKNMQKGVSNENSLVAVTVPAKANKRWSHFEDEALVNCLIEEIQEGGKRCDNGWMPGALAHVALKLRAIVKNPSLESAHVINRLRSIKDKYIAIKEAGSQSGFSITPDGKILADDLAWEAYVQANPKARTLRFSGLRNFDKLCIIFGADHANGNLSYEANDVVHIASLNLDSTTPGDTSDPPEFMNVDSDNPNPGAPNEDASRQGKGAFRVDGQPSGAKSKSQAGQKRRRSIPGGYDRFDESMVAMAEAAKDIAASFGKPVMPRLFQALKGIMELSQEDMKRALIAFGRDHTSAEILLTMEETMRYGFVKDIIG